MWRKSRAHTSMGAHPLCSALIWSNKFQKCNAFKRCQSCQALLFGNKRAAQHGCLRMRFALGSLWHYNIRCNS
ncbi:hypothetical protein BA896_021470 [Janthinobacterium lividum]|uniref:Uncharacterized protein n=1 Tax=Janthinobacterium lividum TaxID=29581 RepID=A0A1E8PJS0_9BURK|nr:hypothetical protein BA896_021470 [Janthinobacterium lividum]